MLGRALIPALEQEGHAVLALAKAEADVTRLEALRSAFGRFRPDWVFHLAAFTRVNDCESQPQHAHLVNGLGAGNAAAAAAEVGAAVLTISTDYVFDGRATRPYREDDPPGPLNVYGASKLAGEVATREANPQHLIVRTSWLFGEGGANFPDAILARARRGESLRVVDDQRGSPTWTRDLAPALVRLANARKFGTYHCTNSGDCTWHAFARHLIQRSGLNVAVEAIRSEDLDLPARRPAYSVLDNERYERVTGHRMPAWTDAADRYLGSRVSTPVASRESRGREGA
jgi:dTDP-4-dehydrorhamnose reductase